MYSHSIVVMSRFTTKCCCALGTNLIPYFIFTDAVFLLRFLRTKKFSVSAACEMLENYLTIRQLYPHWFQKLDIENPEVEAILKTGYIIPLLERDDLGRQIILLRPDRIDPNRCTSENLAKIHSVVCEAYLDDEESQVAGYVNINDHSGLRMGHISMWSFVDIRHLLKCIQNSTPMRHKASHIFNLPSFANAVIEFASAALSEKLRNRIYVSYSTIFIYFCFNFENLYF